ncbi:amylo-alpha-1,6-glucosidase [Xylanimonas sp. McL0601]|uniref:amylo-alpha-1,6-glucosidase n=1 Tax=Xylanimonas sp. McL0601 TaxID=3414739 RepID=UPI003CE7ADC5
MTFPPHPAATDVEFDVRQIPFSYRGAWFDLSPVVGLHQRSETIHLVSHRNGMHAVLALQPVANGAPVPARWTTSSTTLRWTGDDGGTVTAAFEGPHVLRLRGRGLGLRIVDAASDLTPFTGTYLFTDPVDGTSVFTSYETGRRYRLTRVSGALQVVGAEALGAADRAVVAGANGGDWELAIQETTAGALPFTPHSPFPAVVAAADAAFRDYLDAVAPWRDERTPAAALAAYVLWSATVAPEGFLGRESVLMSKHWMDKVWSWDHCFNALALAPGLPDAALDQFLAPFDHQDPTGALPDSVTHSEILFNYVKPPIHGWALNRLRGLSTRELADTELREIHDRVAAWTRFWLVQRRRPGHVLPFYQHGNDSGWDNSTTFDRDRVIESPDLAAFLVLQLETLADLATELGLPAEEWKHERDSVLRALTTDLWRDTEFVAVGALSGNDSTATSLLNLLPLVLGERLPDRVRQLLADRLIAHLTEHGLATEPPTSPRYEADGYWRGPIWAPSTALIEDGLRSSGFTQLADEVSSRFRALCERSGFAENFDALTGAGLRDRAYTWTAAVYLMFAADHVRRI